MIGPGEYFKINKKFVHKTINYFNYYETDKYEESSTESYIKFDEILSGLIPDYINADVPVGTFLSGGIDSPLLNSIINKTSKNFTAYTISSTHSDIDESLHAKKISKHLEINHIVKKFSETNVQTWLNDHFKAFSEPFSDFSSLPTFILTKGASESFKVMISGDGADELFWGYPRFLSTVKFKNWFKFHPTARRIAAYFLRKTGRQITAGIECKNIEEWVFQRMGPFYTQDVSKIMPNSNFSNQTKKLYKHSKNNFQSKFLLKWLKKNEFYGHMQRRLLKVDRASMANGLEVRIPYLDQNIIDFSLQIKPELGIFHNEPKILLKECLKKYLPKTLTLKQKQGFSIDLNSLLRKELKEEVEDTLYSKNLYLSEILDQSVIKQHVKRYYSEKNNNPWEIWTIFTLNKFASTHHLV
jgi:asparagine synthase (glutamine-hydrolysing)